MKRTRLLIGMVFITSLITQVITAQTTPPGFRDHFLSHFDSSMRKLISLAEIIPAEKFSWSPGEGVMTIGQVYAHIARYNYYYPESSLDITAPNDIDVPNLESLEDKAKIIEILRHSGEHVRNAVENMTESQFEQQTKLYGRDVAGWAVLLQLLAHMNEHVGQSIAYARMNGVAPPWSR